MRTIVAVVAFTIAGASSVLGRHQASRQLPLAAEIDGQLTDELRRVEQEFGDAIVRKDADALARLMAPEFTLRIGDIPNGSLPRSIWMENTLTRLKPESFQLRDGTARALANDVAAMSLILSAKGEMEERDFSGEFYLVDFWSKRGGQWQIVARYSSPIGRRPERSNRPVPPPTDVDPELTSSLGQLEQDLAAAAAHGPSDPEALKRIISPDFTRRTAAASGVTASREPWDASGNGRVEGIAERYHAARKLADDVAVVSFVATSMSPPGGRQGSKELYIVDVWSKRTGAWQLIARHSATASP
jgi:ketosteroid isomerase-like protein